MSTKEFLSGLNRDQLKFARDEAQRRIDKIESEDKLTLWIIEGMAHNVACFREHEFDKAKQALADLILSDDFVPDDVGMDHPRIQKYRVYESEVSQYMELNQ